MFCFQAFVQKTWKQWVRIAVWRWKVVLSCNHQLENETLAHDVEDLHLMSLPEL